MNESISPGKIRAICLFSGGLDSQLAARLLLEQGVEVSALAFNSVFFESCHAEAAARRLGIPIMIEKFTQKILPLLSHPKHGFGAGMNPCIDCHIAMVKRAGEIMRERDFHFVATGEVLNQRPMSQHRRALQLVAEESLVGDCLLRPLSARLLPETEPEKRRWVARERLLALSGKNRKPQMELARELGITEYPQPAGGCLLTDPQYGRRLRDLREHEGLGVFMIQRLRIGRHFRVGSNRVIIGRNQAENLRLEQQVRPDEFLIKANGIQGPIAIISASSSENEALQAAALCARYSDAPPGKPVLMEIHGAGSSRALSVLPASPEMVEGFRIRTGG